MLYFIFFCNFTENLTKFVCALNVKNEIQNSKLLSFTFNTFLTYIFPYVLLCTANCILVYILIRVKTKRKTFLKNKSNSNFSKISMTKSSNFKNVHDVDNETRSGSITKPKKTTEIHKEYSKIISLLFLSCFYLCLTFPVSLALTIRANLENNKNQCEPIFYGHLSRILTSIKDINYVINGYSYALFFQFYRKKLFKLFTCFN